MSVRNEINLMFPENQPNLLYLIIVEGINVDPLLYSSDYHAYLTTFLPACDDSEQLCRDALADHNAAMLALIESTILDASDVLTIQFVFWGDYNELPDATNFLDLDYLLSFSGSTFQFNKE